MAGKRAKITGPTLVCVAGILLVLIYALRHVLIPFVLAAAMAYVFVPLVRFLQRRLGGPRWVSAVLIYLLLVGALTAWTWRGGTLLYASVSRFSVNGQEELNRLLTRLLGGGQVAAFGVRLEAQQIAADILGRIQKAWNSPQAAMLAGLGASVAFGTALFLVLLFYFFVSGPQLAKGTLRLAPPEYRDAIATFGERVNPVLQRYLRGLCAIVIYSAVVSWIGVGPIFHLPHPLFLAIATGLLELIPIIGPTTSATIVGAAVALHGGTAWTFAGFGLFWFCLRMSIDQVVGPLVLGQAVHVHPVAI